MLSKYPLFDSHLHIIDPRYSLVENQGYLPPPFTCNDYLSRMSSYNLCGGAVVSGSFQGFDQEYLLNALKVLGPAFVGVSQLPRTVSDTEILALNSAGVRAVRFNMKRGGSEEIRHLSYMAARINELAGWHVELYVDSVHLPDMQETLLKLPALSIDHLGLSRSGLKCLTRLAEKGVKIKATGFGRVDFPVREIIRDIYLAHPAALMFGTDLPSTRAPSAYSDSDFSLVAEVLGSDGASRVFKQNAVEFYRPGSAI